MNIFEKDLHSEWWTSWGMLRNTPLYGPEYLNNVFINEGVISRNNPLIVKSMSHKYVDTTLYWTITFNHQDKDQMSED